MGRPGEGVDFRWVRPSGRAGLAVAWRGGGQFCARAALAIPASWKRHVKIKQAGSLAATMAGRDY
jgi:hypothetical protein